jgi:hypothetical protein
MTDDAIASEHKRKCTCSICTTFTRWENVLQIDTPEKREVFCEILDRIESVETDLCYYKSILDGSWPHSVERLEKALEQARLKRSQNETGI